MPTPADVLDRARAELGYHEMPPGSNKTKFAAEAGHANGQPWCATFVVAMFRRAGLHLPSESAFTPTMANGFRREARWDEHGHIGDVVFYDFPGGHTRIEHVGIVESIESHHVTAIEGNTSSGDDTNGGAVQRRRRSLVNVVGFGRPAYGLTPPAPPQEDDMAYKIWNEDGHAEKVLVLQTTNGYALGWHIATREKLRKVRQDFPAIVEEPQPHAVMSRVTVLGDLPG